MRYTYLNIPLLILKLGLAGAIVFILASFIQPKGEVRQTPLDNIGMGTSMHLRVGIDELSPVYQQLSEMNIHWIREEFPWSEIEQTPGEFTFAYGNGQFYRDFDAMLAMADRYDLEVVAVLTGGPAYLPHVYPDQPVDGDLMLQHWAEYVQAVVSRYGDKINYWQIGSEINNAAQWGQVMFPTVSGASSTPSSFLYAGMLSSARKIIKDHNPRDTIILGGLYNSSSSDCRTSPTAYLADLVNSGAWNNFDVIAIHPYWQNNPPEVWMPRGPVTSAESGICQPDTTANSNMLGEIRKIKAFAEEYGTKPVWITALGWSEEWLSAISAQNGFSSDQLQANFVVRSIIPLISEEGVGKVFWYTLYDDPANSGFSLNPQGQIAYKNLGLLLGGARPLGQFQATGDLGTPDELGLFEYRFRKEGRTIIYTWSANGGEIPYPITLEDLPGSKYRAYAIDALDLSLESGMELSVSDEQSITIYVNEIPALLIEENPNLLSSLRFRVEDGLTRWFASQKASANNWLNLQKQKMLNVALDWAEKSVLNLLNDVVNKLSGG